MILTTDCRVDHSRTFQFIDADLGPILEIEVRLLILREVNLYKKKRSDFYLFVHSLKTNKENRDEVVTDRTLGSPVHKRNYVPWALIGPLVSS